MWEAIRIFHTTLVYALKIKRNVNFYCSGFLKVETTHSYFTRTHVHTPVCQSCKWKKLLTVCKSILLACSYKHNHWTHVSAMSNDKKWSSLQYVEVFCWQAQITVLLYNALATVNSETKSAHALAQAPSSLLSPLNNLLQKANIRVRSCRAYVATYLVGVARCVCVWVCPSTHFLFCSLLYAYLVKFLHVACPITRPFVAAADPPLRTKHHFSGSCEFLLMRKWLPNLPPFF